MTKSTNFLESACMHGVPALLHCVRPLPEVLVGKNNIYDRSSCSCLLSYGGLSYLCVSNLLAAFFTCLAMLLPCAFACYAVIKNHVGSTPALCDLTSPVQSSSLSLSCTAPNLLQSVSVPSSAGSLKPFTLTEYLVGEEEPA